MKEEFFLICKDLKLSYSSFISLSIDESKHLIVQVFIVVLLFFIPGVFSIEKFINDGEIFFNSWLEKFIVLKAIIPICTILIGIVIANSLIRYCRSKKSIFSEFYYYIDTLVLQRISNTIFGIFVLIFSSISSLLIWLVLNPHHADCNFATFLQLFKYAIASFICFINFHCSLKFLLKIAKTKNESNHPNHPRQSANA